MGAQSVARTALLGIAIVMASTPVAASPDVQEARQLLEDWQLEEALERAQRLLSERPDDPEVWDLAARVQHHRGEHQSALRLFDAALEAGIETGYVHDLARNSAAYAAHFKTLSTEHFDIRYLNKDEIVAHYAAPVLEAAYTRIGGALELQAAERGERIVVEIYPNARGLSGATGLTVQEIATSGTIAVCKFHRLMITSPLATADGYSWADTIAHEFVHLLVSKKSLDSIPIWLHEGIAKYYESLWKSSAGEALSPYSENLLASAARKREFVTFEQMHPSMAKLPSQEQAALAFAEVFTTIEFLNSKYGPESIPRVLQLTGEGVSLEQALRRVYKLSLDGIESSWRRWVVKRPFKIVPGAKPQKIRLASDESQSSEEAPLEKMKDRKVHDYSRLGELLQLRGHARAAVTEYEKAYARAGLKYPSLTYRLARAYTTIERNDDAVSLLEKTLEVHPESADNHLLAGRIRLDQKKYPEARKHFEAVRMQNPFNPEIHEALAALYRAQGMEGDAVAEERFFALSKKARPTRVYELPTPAAGDSRISLIPPRWNRIRIDGGEPIAAPLWNHPIPSGQHSVEFIAPDGTAKIFDFSSAPGESQRVVLK